MELSSREIKFGEEIRESIFIIYLRKQLIKSKRRKEMLDKITEMLDMLPDTVKMILIISAIAIFWDFILG